MKVLVVTSYYHPYVGGLEIYARQLNIALEKLQGMEIVIATSSDQKGIHTDDVDGMKVYRLGRWLTVSNTPFNPLWTRQLKQIITREKPDVIIAHAPVPSMAAAASRAKGTTPFIVVYHAATLYKKGHPVFNMAAWVYQLLGKRLMQRADSIFAVSDFVKDNLHSDLQQKAVVIPNAVWAEDIVAKKQTDSKDFIFIGSLNRSHAWKGLELILKAVAQCRQELTTDITLTVLGDGDMRQEYEQQARELSIADYVQFRGTTTGEAKRTAINNARALIVYPTTENDAFPTVILEAWAQYTPVIAGRIGAVGSLINDGADGFLVEPDSAQALADGLRDVAETPLYELKDVAKRAATRTHRNYTWERQSKTVKRRIGDLL